LVNLDVHITNNAIQKNSPNYDPDKGAKWSVQNLRQYLIAKHGLEEVIELQCYQIINKYFDLVEFYGYGFRKLTFHSF
jgi:tubulin polyglutamylase TTLL9